MTVQVRLVEGILVEHSDYMVALYFTPPETRGTGERGEPAAVPGPPAPKG